jgi:chromosome segregation ATPase
VIEFILILLGVLMAATLGAAFEYYRQVRKAQREYEKAKEAVEDIVLSFNRELKREAENLEMVAFKVEGSASKADSGLKRVDAVERKVTPLEGQVNAVSETNASILARLADVDVRTRNIEGVHETLKTKITVLDEQVQKLLTGPEVKGEAVIPIKRQSHGRADGYRSDSFRNAYDGRV